MSNHQASIKTSVLNRVEPWVTLLSVFLASFGGFMLAAISLLTLLSIIGRELIPFGLKPIPGDFELVEVGVAIAVFSFMPYCHIKKGHMTVDILMSSLPKKAFNFTTLLGDLAVLAFSTLIAARLWLGLQEKLSYGESTMILEMPSWYGYAASFVAAVIFALVSLFVIWKDSVLMLNGEKVQ